jgi:hypothetical protein
MVEVNDTFFYENQREIDFSLTKRLEDYRVELVERAVVATVIHHGYGALGHSA